MASQSGHENVQQAPQATPAGIMQPQRMLKNFPILNWVSYKEDGVSYSNWRNVVLQSNAYDEVSEEEIVHDWRIELNNAYKAGLITVMEATALAHQAHAPLAIFQLFNLELKNIHLFSESHADNLYLKAAPVTRGPAQCSTSYFVLELSRKKVVYIPDTTECTLDDLSPEKFFDTLIGLNEEIIPRGTATGIWEYVIQNIYKHLKDDAKKRSTEALAYSPCDAYWNSELDVNFVRPNLVILPIVVKDEAFNEDTYVKLARTTQYFNPLKPVNAELIESAWNACFIVVINNYNLQVPTSTTAADKIPFSDRIRRWWVAVECSQEVRLQHEMTKRMNKDPHHPLHNMDRQEQLELNMATRGKHWIDMMIIVSPKVVCVPLCRAGHLLSYPDYVNFDHQLFNMNPDRAEYLSKRANVDYHWKIAKGFDLQTYVWAGDEDGLKTVQLYWKQKEEDRKHKGPTELDISKAEINSLKETITEKDDKWEEILQFKDDRIESLEEDLQEMRLKMPADLLEENDKLRVELNEKDHHIKELKNRMQVLRDRNRALRDHNEELAHDNIALEKGRLSHNEGLVLHNEELARKNVALEKEMLSRHQDLVEENEDLYKRNMAYERELDVAYGTGVESNHSEPMTDDGGEVDFVEMSNEAEGNDQIDLSTAD